MAFSPLTSCLDDVDDPVTESFSVTSPTSVGEVNVTIEELKHRYCTIDVRTNATYSRNTSNWEFLISDDQVFEGVICSNDGPYGNLYQYIFVRDMVADGSDQCISIGIKNTCLYPYFPIGQRVRINLKGLYVGAYSRLPKIGFPYYTSSGNHNLGPIPLEMCATNFQLIGEPDPDAPECKPIDLTGANGGINGNSWLGDKSNQTIDSYPTIATVEGRFVLGDDVSILAPDELEDAGYAVDRDFDILAPSGTKSVRISIRTSTGNEISHLVMPRDKTVRLTGVLMFDSYNSRWQMNLRDVNDFVVLDN